MPLGTPVAFFIFNRPDHTRQVFEAIAAARPARLLIVADGARPGHPGEADRVAAARDVVSGIDWPCVVERNYSALNIGCGRRIAGGLDWVFQAVNEAIILEDDCVPNPSFFPFCEELLDRYRDDHRVMGISGTAVRSGRAYAPHSYYFSRYFHGWGWATWRRAWRMFDFEMTSWPEFRDNGGLACTVDSIREYTYWSRILDLVHTGRVDIWDYQWQHASWVQGGLFVTPCLNMVTNIGFGPDATHTRDTSHPFSNVPTVSIGPLEHPPEVRRNRAADRAEFRARLRGYREQDSLVHRFLNSFRRLGGASIAQ